MSEAKEQAVLYRWFCLQYPKYRRSWSYSMNGSCWFPGATKLQRIKMISHFKSQGMQNGEADFKILVARGDFHGLVIELKAAKGKHKLTVEQAEHLGYMGSQGYMAVCCKGGEAARETIKSYMEASRGTN